MYDVLALGGINLIHLLGQGERVLFFERVLPGIDLFCGFDIGVCKKLLRFSTGLSARPVIRPLKFCHFHGLHWIDEKLHSMRTDCHAWSQSPFLASV